MSPSEPQTTVRVRGKYGTCGCPTHVQPIIRVDTDTYRQCLVLQQQYRYVPRHDYNRRQRREVERYLRSVKNNSVTVRLGPTGDEVVPTRDEGPLGSRQPCTVVLNHDGRIEQMQKQQLMDFSKLPTTMPSSIFIMISHVTHTHTHTHK